LIKKKRPSQKEGCGTENCSSLVESGEPLVCVEEGGGARVEELRQLLHQGQHSLTTQLVSCTLHNMRRIHLSRVAVTPSIRGRGGETEGKRQKPLLGKEGIY
jgi:hypothetical protein